LQPTRHSVGLKTLELAGYVVHLASRPRRNRPREDSNSNQHPDGTEGQCDACPTKGSNLAINADTYQYGSAVPHAMGDDSVPRGALKHELRRFGARSHGCGALCRGTSGGSNDVPGCR
jgi:hypothetical protein